MGSLFLNFGHFPHFSFCHPDMLDIDVMVLYMYSVKSFLNYS